MLLLPGKVSLDSQVGDTLLSARIYQFNLKFYKLFSKSVELWKQYGLTNNRKCYFRFRTYHLSRSKCSLKVVVSTFPSAPTFEVPEAPRCSLSSWAQNAPCYSESVQNTETWYLPLSCFLLNGTWVFLVAVNKECLGSAIGLLCSYSFWYNLHLSELRHSAHHCFGLSLALLFSQNMVCQFETLNLNIW